MRLLQQCLAGFLLLPLFLVGLLYFTAGEWTEVAAAAFPVGAIVLRHLLAARARTTTDPINRDVALPWLVLPAVVLAAGLLPVHWTTDVEIADGGRLVAFLAITLIAPNRCGGWRTPVRWLAATAVLLLPEVLHTRGVALDALLAALRIAVLADFIRTGLSDRDVRADRLLAAVGLGVVIALQRSVLWLPIAVLAVATAELTAAGSLSHQVQSVKPRHDRSRRWFSRGRFLAAIAVAAILWAWSVAQLSPLGYMIHERGPVLALAAHRYVQEALASAIPDVTSQRSVNPKARAAKLREATARPAPKPGEPPASRPAGADHSAGHPPVSPESGDAAAESTPREAGPGSEPSLRPDLGPQLLPSLTTDRSAGPTHRAGKANETSPGPADRLPARAIAPATVASDSTEQISPAAGGRRSGEESTQPLNSKHPPPDVGDAALVPPVVLSPGAGSGLTLPAPGDGLKLDLPGSGNGRGDDSRAPGGSTSSPDSGRSPGAPGTAGDARSAANGNGSSASGASGQSQGTPPGAGRMSAPAGQPGGGAASGSGSSLDASNAAITSSSGAGQSSRAGGAPGGGESSGGPASGRGGASQSLSAGGAPDPATQTSGAAAGNTSGGEQRNSASSASPTPSVQLGGSPASVDARTGANSTQGGGTAASKKDQDSSPSVGGVGGASGGRSAQSPAEPRSTVSARSDSAAKKNASNSGGSPTTNPPGTTAATTSPKPPAANATRGSSPVAAPGSSDGAPPSVGSKPGESAAFKLVDVRPTPSEIPNQAAAQLTALPTVSPPVQSPAKETGAAASATEPAKPLPPFPAPNSSPAGLDGAIQAAKNLLDLRPWILPAALALVLALLVVAKLFWRKKPPAPASLGQLVIEDRRKAGRCLYEIEDLLRRSAPPDVAEELTQLHRVGLHLRYGIEFSRDKVTQLEGEVRRLRRATEMFGKRLNAGAKRRA